MTTPLAPNVESFSAIFEAVEGSDRPKLEAGHPRSLSGGQSLSLPKGVNQIMMRTTYTALCSVWLNTASGVSEMLYYGTGGVSSRRMSTSPRRGFSCASALRSRRRTRRKPGGLSSTASNQPNRGGAL